MKYKRFNGYLKQKPQRGGVLTEAALAIALLILVLLGIFDINQILSERSVLNKALEDTGEAMRIRPSVNDCEGHIGTLHLDTESYLKFYLEHFYNQDPNDFSYLHQVYQEPQPPKQSYLLISIKKNQGLGIFGLTGLFPVCSTMFVPINVSKAQNCDPDDDYSWEVQNGLVTEELTLIKGKNDRDDFC